MSNKEKQVRPNDLLFIKKGKTVNNTGQKVHVNKENQLVVYAVVVFIVMLLALTGCDRPGKKKPSGQAVKLTLGVGSGLLMSPIWVADKNGYFQEEGLDLTIKKYKTGKASFENMLNGVVDISTLAPTPIMFNSFVRQDYAIFATFASSDVNVKVIGRKDAGINSAQDLKGKRVGITARTSSHFVLSSFLFYNGIAESEIEVVNISPPELPDSLTNNRVDAIVIWEPFAYIAQQLLQDNNITLPSSKIYKETFNCVVMKDYARDNPQVLEKFLRAVDRAEKYIQSHKQQSQDIVSANLQMDKEILSILWEDFVFELSLAQTLLITLEDEARWAIKSGFTDKTRGPNYLDYIYIDALEEVKPEAVTIIR